MPSITDSETGNHQLRNRSGGDVLAVIFVSVGFGWSETVKGVCTGAGSLRSVVNAGITTVPLSPTFVGSSVSVG